MKQKLLSRLRKIARARRLNRNIGEFVSSGLFDAEYISLSTGLVFRSAEDACRYYLTHGAKRSEPFHPLIDPWYFPTEKQRLLGSIQVGKFITYLNSEVSREHRWSEFIDPPACSAEIRNLAAADLLAELAQLDFLPTSERSAHALLSYRDAVEFVTTAAAESAEQQKIKRSLNKSNWDAVAESEFTKRVSQFLLVDEPLVSVVVPVRNRPEAIEQALNSIRNQKYSNWEAIVVDDGSIDSTAEVVERIIEQESRITMVRSDRGGAAHARNVAIRSASGEWIAFLDSDETWRPDYLNLMLRGLRSSESEAAICASQIMRNRKKYSFAGGEISSADLIAGAHVPLSSFMAKTAIVKDVGGFDEELMAHSSRDFMIRITQHSATSYFPFLGVDVDLSQLQADRLSMAEPTSWKYVVTQKHLLDWNSSAQTDRIPGLVSIIVPIDRTMPELYETYKKFRSTVSECGHTNIEIVLVDSGSDRLASRILSATARQLAPTTVVRKSLEDSKALFFNLGLSYSRGEFVVMVDLAHHGQSNWLALLLMNLQRPNVVAVQSLIALKNGTVANAGYTFVGTRATPTLLMYQLPIDDMKNHGGGNIQALAITEMLHRADDAIAIGGCDPLFETWLSDVDYSLRLISHRSGELVVDVSSLVGVEKTQSAKRSTFTILNDQQHFETKWPSNKLPQSRVDDYDSAGLRGVGIDPDLHHPRLIVTRDAREVEIPAWGRIPSLRWALKIPAPFGTPGDEYGDVYFAQDLARALNKLGQEVVIDRTEAFNRPTAYLDDVVVNLRGHFPVASLSNQIIVTWVLYSPERIPQNELRASDLVYSSSSIWAQFKSRELGIDVRPLLQATSPERFSPKLGVAANEHIVFIGSPRSTGSRRVIDDAIEAQANLQVWGPRWGQYIDPGFVAGDWISPDEVVETYRSAAAVLNDHWPSMAEMGFINNRMFDAAASGARIVSDYVEGAAEIFGPQLKMYRNIEELKSILSPEGLASFPPQEQLVTMAENIREHHSFEARAATLLRDVLEIWNTKISSRR